MLQLETRKAVVCRRLAAEHPELFERGVHLLPWEYTTFKDANVDWEDRSYHKTLTCKNHPRSRWTTKNPWDRSIFPVKGVYGVDMIADEECLCAFSDLRVVIQ